jgi:hypothetical protein
MPKEKTTKRATKARVEKKKKGKLPDARLITVTDICCPDPNAPKRGLSAYMFFANDQRDTVREENPGITFGTCQRCFVTPVSVTDNCIGQVGKMLGEKWKGLSDKQKAPYEAKAAQDKKRYEEEKANYQVCYSLQPLYASANTVS